VICCLLNQEHRIGFKNKSLIKGNPWFLSTGMPVTEQIPGDAFVIVY
jgi:hypothetical protein